MVRAHDGSHQVAAECRTSPCNVAGLFINVKACAVSRKTGSESGGEAGAKVTAVRCSADHDCGGGILLNYICKCVYICVSCELLILRSFDHDDLICAVDAGLLNSLSNVVADDYADQFATLLCRKGTAGIQELQTDFLRGTVFVSFNKYPKVFCLCFHVLSLLSDNAIINQNLSEFRCGLCAGLFLDLDTALFNGRSKGLLNMCRRSCETIVSLIHCGIEIIA